jgi:predicted phosphodiesterase/biotin operon repressor
MAPKVPWWHDREKLLAAIRRHGSAQAAAIASAGEVSTSTLHLWARKHGIALTRSTAGGTSLVDDAPDNPAAFAGPLESQLTGDARALLQKARDPLTIDELADALDVSPRRAREAVQVLRDEGFRVVDDETEPGSVRLEKLPPATSQVTRLDLQGDEVTVGIVSDTHLGSREEALPELRAVYDEFAARGIDTVWHAGDLTAGVGIYRGQVANGLMPGMHTYREQVEYATEVYPKVEGITTYIIAGNHDIEGEAGRIGADPVQAVCHRRRDMVYCGAYHGSLELPNGAHATMVHGRGGGGYAMSYKPQRYVESLPPGRKPALLVFGHWHVSGFFRHRQVTCLLAGCFEWQTDLLVRLGLQPDVGAWIVTLRLGDDGSVVGIRPEWLGFYAGRRIEAA